MFSLSISGGAVKHDRALLYRAIRLVNRIIPQCFGPIILSRTGLSLKGTGKLRATSRSGKRAVDNWKVCFLILFPFNTAIQGYHSIQYDSSSSAGLTNQ